VAALRLSPRQWRLYLVTWLVAVAAVIGVGAGLVIPKLTQHQPPPRLGGGMVMPPRAVQAPDFSLVDQQGKAISLSGLRGRVVALTFLDTLCTNVCPLQARMLGGVQHDLGSSVPLSVVVISVRPEADTTAAVTAFATTNGLRSYHWLGGQRSELMKVWNAYGVAVQVANGDLEHSSVIYLIDRAGFERVGFLDVPDAGAFENDVRTLAGS
jgi:cytochrome oxidase Cu insertion factor (SCO1/SenC/PrrC family)